MTTCKELPTFSSKYWHKKCPTQCRARCSILHHPLIVALINCEKGHKGTDTTQEFKDLKIVFQHYYEKSDLELDDNIPDPVEAYQLPLMHWAAALGLISVVKWILAEGGSQHPGYPDTQPSTPLHRALIDLQMNCPNDGNKKFTSLLPLLNECLKLKDVEGNSVLHSSAFMVANAMPWINFHIHCYKAIHDFARSHTPDGSCLTELTTMLNNKGNTPLHYIAKNFAKKPNNPFLLDLLLKMIRLGISFDVPNAEGKTARRLVHPYLPQGSWYSKRLKESEPISLSQRAQQCTNPILKAAINTDLSVLGDLIEQHAVDNWTIDDFVEDDEDGLAFAMPLIHWAAAFGCSKVIRWLMARGASLLPPGIDRSPLHTALELFHCHVETSMRLSAMKDLIPMLVQCLSVADVMGNTPLHTCLILMAQSDQSTELTEFYVKVFNLLLSAAQRENASVLNHTNKNGDNLLHLVLRSEEVNLSICKQLIVAGVDRCAANSLGETPAAMTDNPSHPCSALLATFPEEDAVNKESLEQEEEEEEDEEGMEIEEEDCVASEPVITIEKDGNMIDLVGEKDIIAFLSTLKAPSPTLSNFYMHILKTKDFLAKELQTIDEKTKDAKEKHIKYEAQHVDYNEKKFRLEQRSQTLCAEEAALLKDIRTINEQIEESDKTRKGLQETLSHCQGALSVLKAEEAEPAPRTPPIKLNFDNE